LLLVAFLLVNAPNCHHSLVLASVVQGDAVNCNNMLPQVYHRIIPADMEKDLASHISCLADLYYGLLLEICKQLEYELAEVFRILGIRIKKLANSGGLASRTDTTCPSDLLK